MLLFIAQSIFLTTSVFGFQYISCCYLSISGNRFGNQYRFQYISCCYLSIFLAHKSWLTSVSIHLMLLFIMDALNVLPLNQKFQYISCCYLSIISKIFLAETICFNTSHVVIYLCPVRRYAPRFF